MATTASKILELFLKSFNTNEHMQTMFTCIAVEDYSYECVDAGIMQGYLAFLGTEYLERTRPDLLEMLTIKNLTVMGTKSITLDDLVDPVSIPEFMEAGLKIFQSQVKFRSNLYWSQENVDGVCLRFGILAAMGEFEFAGVTFHTEEL